LLSLVAQRSVKLTLFINNRYWARVDGVLSIVVAFAARIIVKLIVDFSGCIHFRHPFEMGGLGFSTAILWSQIFPFVALSFYEESTDDIKSNVMLFLVCSFTLWLILSIAFFCTIDLKYIFTFFTTKTAPQ